MKFKFQLLMLSIAFVALTSCKQASGEKADVSDAGEVAEQQGVDYSVDVANSVINWEGSVLPCCSVYSEKHSFGNIKEDSFRNIWNNKKYISARREVLGRKNNAKTVCHICRANDYLYI